MEEIKFELIIGLKLIVSTVLGAFIGYDRERQDMDAGIRTYAAVCLRATLFTAVAEHRYILHVENNSQHCNGEDHQQWYVRWKNKIKTTEK